MFITAIIAHIIKYLFSQQGVCRVKKDEYFIFSEYMKKDDNPLTASLEDYLEMIYRLCGDHGFIRIHDLAVALNVQPSSVTKAVQKLAELALLDYEKYGLVKPTLLGKEMGQLLLKRHNTIKEFLEIVGVTEVDLLRETEKTEHTISSKTIGLLNCLLSFLLARPDILEDWGRYRRINNPRI